MAIHGDELNMVGNEIKNGKVTNTRTTPLDGDNTLNSEIASTDYVEDSQVYRTEITDENGDGLETSDVTIGAITVGTQVEGLSHNELFDKIFHPPVAPIYAAATLALTSGTHTNGQILEVGEVINIDLLATVTLNDQALSSPLTPYLWSGGNLVAGQSSSNTQSDNGYTIQNTSNTWTVAVDVDDAAIKNNSHGIPDVTGRPLATTLARNLIVNGVWGAWIFNGEPETAPTDTTTLRALSGKFLQNSYDGVYNLAVLSGTEKNVIIVVPDDSDTKQLNVIKDGALPITASFIKSRIIGVSDLTNSGQTQNYTVWYHTNGVGYSTDSNYKITIS